MWWYMASTSAISWGVGFLAAAAIQRRPLWDVYQVRPSTLHTKTHKQQCYICLHCPDRNHESARALMCIFTFYVDSSLLILYTPYLLMPLTSSEAHGWCMLRHQPPSDISCSSLSWSRNLERSSPPLSFAKLCPFSMFLSFFSLEFSLLPMFTH